MYRLLGGKVHRQFAPSPPPHLPAGTLLPRFHGREVRAVALASIALPPSPNAPRGTGQRTVELMYTGAENAVSRLSSVGADGGVRTLWEDPRPVAAVKAVAIVGRGEGRAVLFAAGVREHVRAWGVEVGEEGEGGQVAARVRALGEAGTVTDSGGEVRVMDMVVLPLDPDAGTHLGITCLSDGWLWAWVFDERTGVFRHVAGTGWHGRCVLSLATVEVGERVWVLSGAADGMVAGWDLTELRERLRVDPGAGVEGAWGEPVVEHRAHLSGVNGLDVVAEGESAGVSQLFQPPSFLTDSYSRPLSAPTADPPTLLLATAGDDNSLTLSRLTLPTSPSPPTTPTLTLTLTPLGSLPHAHSSTIQGLKLLSPTVLLSNSVDQRLSVHRLATGAEERVEEEGKELFRLVGAKEVGVADCSGMGCLERGEGGWRVAVVGIGAELIDLEMEE